MALARRLRLKITLAFALAIQVAQGLHGYTWWMLFSGLGVWSLSIPVTTTYGGAAMVAWDDTHGVCYTSDWARVCTAAFLSFFFTLSAVAVCAVVQVVLGLFGIVA